MIEVVSASTSAADPAPAAGPLAFDDPLAALTWLRTHRDSLAAADPGTVAALVAAIDDAAALLAPGADTTDPDPVDRDAAAPDPGPLDVTPDDPDWSVSVRVLDPDTGFFVEPDPDTAPDPAVADAGERSDDTDPTDVGVDNPDHHITYAQAHDLTHPMASALVPASLRRPLLGYHVSIRDALASNPRSEYGAFTRRTATTRFVHRTLVKAGRYGLTSGEIRRLAQYQWSPWSTEERHHGMISSVLHDLEKAGYIVRLADPNRPGDHIKRLNVRGIPEGVYVVLPARLSDFTAFVQGLEIRAADPKTACPKTGRVRASRTTASPRSRVAAVDPGPQFPDDSDGNPVLFGG